MNSAKVKVPRLGEFSGILNVLIYTERSPEDAPCRQGAEIRVLAAKLALHTMPSRQSLKSLLLAGRTCHDDQKAALF